MTVFIAVVLVEYRKKHKLSQYALGKLLGVSQEQICKWERSKHIPSPLRKKDILAILEKV